MGYNMRRNQQQMPSLNQLMKLQEEMGKKQQELENSSFEGTAGGGAVTLTLKGNYEVVAVKISPEAVDPEDVASLEDLLIAAAHDAFDKVRAQQEKLFGGMLGGMKIPGM